jgi:hypothetical protein
MKSGGRVGRVLLGGVNARDHDEGLFTRNANFMSPIVARRRTTTIGLFLSLSRDIWRHEIRVSCKYSFNEWPSSIGFHQCTYGRIYVYLCTNIYVRIYVDLCMYVCMYEYLCTYEYV